MLRPILSGEVCIIKRLSISILLLLALFASVSFAESGIRGTSFLVYSDTGLQDQDGVALKASFGKVSLQDLETLSFRSPDQTELLPDTSSPVEVMLVLPKDVLSKPDVEDLKKSIASRLHKRGYGKIKFKIKLMHVDVEHEIQNGERANHEIRHTAGEDAGPVAQELIEKNKFKINFLKTWSSSFKRSVRKLLGRPKSRDMAAGSLIGGSKGVYSASVYLAATGANPYGITQAGAAFLWDLLWGRYVRAITDYQADMEVPGGEKVNLIQWLNGSSMAKVFLGRWLMTAAYIAGIRELGFLAGKIQDSPASLAFLGELSGLLTVELMFSSYGDLAIRNLRRKGRLHPTMEYLFYQTFGTLGYFNLLRYSSGQIDPIFWTGLAVEWTGRSAMMLLSKVIPTKDNRFVIVHPAVGKENAEYVMALEESLKVRNYSMEEWQSLQKKKKFTHKSKKKKGLVKRFFSFVYQKFMNSKVAGFMKRFFGKGRCG